MLSLWILNVGHGNSAIIRCDSPEGRSFGVVDSNHSGSAEPRLLQKLKELGAEELQFVALTHPHADHYLGLLEVLEAYQGKIHQFYSFPLTHHIIERLSKYANLYAQIYKSSDSKTIRSAAKEFIKLLVHVKENVHCWDELTGEFSMLSPPGFVGVEICSILPPAGVKGQFFQMIDQGKVELVGSEKENELSVAFCIDYKGARVVLGGDGTYPNWMDHKRRFGNQNKRLAAHAVKLPHHGSAQDCQKAVLEHIFTPKDGIAFISANGHTHPHADTLKNLKELGITPYCTNLAKQCGANIRELADVSELSPRLRKFIAMVAVVPTGRAAQPCQGDIEVRIDDAGTLTVSPQFQHPCPYRSNYAGLF